MRISTVHVQNYRSIRDQILNCSGLTALVGANGTGKSAFLNAVNLFYSTSERISASDFYNGDPSNAIVIAVTFTDLSEEARELFASRLEGDSLNVEKVVGWNNGKPQPTYHGSTLQHPDFARIRGAVGLHDRGATARVILEELRATGAYVDLPQWTTIEETLAGLAAWEGANPDKCARIRDDGQFFGFRQVAQGYLGRFTTCIFIEAVRDAAGDASEARGTVFSDLMDLVVRSSLAQRPEVLDLKRRLQEEYHGLLHPENLPELGNLATELSGTLQTFVPNSQVLLEWLPLDELDVPTPKADMRIVEDGYAAHLENCGHGLQRAFILTMLQHLAMASYSRTERSREQAADEMPEENAVDLSNLVLLVEEPELYQHPTRQRHMARVLAQLSEGTTPGVAARTQVFYSTHSPHFVGMDRINSLRLLKKAAVPGDLPNETKVIQVELAKVAEELWFAAGQTGARFTAQTLLPRLTAIMTPMLSEGFFADVAVLVEGEDDRAALLGAAMQMGIDLDSQGIAVIPCGGKPSIDRPTAIFRALGIPLYLVWDSDMGKAEPNPETNRLLLSLLGEVPEDWPSGVKGTYACFEVDLETALRQDLGNGAHDRLVAACQADFSIPKKKDAMKNPHVVAEVVRRAAAEGRSCETLEGILKAILALKNT